MRTNICATLILAISLSGCAARQQQVTNLPTGVTQAQAQNWDTAVANLNKVAEFTSSTRQAVIALNKQGVFPDGPAYVTTLQVLGKVDTLQLSASALLKQSPNNFSDTVKGQVKDYLFQIAAQISVLNTSGIIGIKNPSSQQQVAQLIAQLTGVVDIILSL